MIFRAIDSVIGAIFEPIVEKVFIPFCYKTALGIKFERFKSREISEQATKVISDFQSGEFKMVKNKWINADSFNSFYLVSDKLKYSVCFQESIRRGPLSTYEGYISGDGWRIDLSGDDIFFVACEAQKLINSGQIKTEIVDEYEGKYDNI